MTSATDDKLIAGCQKENRALITLDLDFANPLVFPPNQFSGIVVLRLPTKATLANLNAAMQTLVNALKSESLTSKLWSIEIGRLRIYDPSEGLSPRSLLRQPAAASKIAGLWTSGSQAEWMAARGEYPNLIKRPVNLKIEREFEVLRPDDIRALNASSWYDWLHNKYFVWKYTAGNRLATTRKALRYFKEENKLDELDAIRKQLLEVDRNDIQTALEIAHKINGLGPAGASGLLAVIYPEHFGTVDQFAVKALCLVPGLPELQRLKKMKPESLTISDAVALIEIMRKKAAALNLQFGTSSWTPRKIDMVLWAMRESTN